MLTVKTLTKAEEVEALRAFAARFGPATYLGALFSAELLDHVEQTIHDDHWPNLMAEITAANESADHYRNEMNVAKVERARVLDELDDARAELIAQQDEANFDRKTLKECFDETKTALMKKQAEVDDLRDLLADLRTSVNLEVGYWKIKAEETAQQGGSEWVVTKIMRDQHAAATERWDRLEAALSK